MLQKPIFLVGPMGAGKSTVGKALAQALQCDFFDLDELIVQRAGMAIPEMFKQGEPFFRNFEHQCLAACLLKPYAKQVVIAGGGGVAGREDNRQLIRRQSVCVYLKAPVEVQYARVNGDENRPMLKSENDDVLGRLKQLFAIRDPLFNEVAKMTLDATLPVSEVVTACLAQLKTIKA